MNKLDADVLKWLHVGFICTSRCGACHKHGMTIDPEGVLKTSRLSTLNDYGAIAVRFDEYKKTGRLPR